MQDFLDVMLLLMLLGILEFWASKNMKLPEHCCCCLGEVKEEWVLFILLRCFLLQHVN